MQNAGRAWGPCCLEEGQVPPALSPLPTAEPRGVFLASRVTPKSPFLLLRWSPPSGHLLLAALEKGPQPKAGAPQLAAMI